jgi:hypothetical protein
LKRTDARCEYWEKNSLQISAVNFKHEATEAVLKQAEIGQDQAGSQGVFCLAFYN